MHKTYEAGLLQCRQAATTHVTETQPDCGLPTSFSSTDNRQNKAQTLSSAVAAAVAKQGTFDKEPCREEVYLRTSVSQCTNSRQIFTAATHSTAALLQVPGNAIQRSSVLRQRERKTNKDRRVGTKTPHKDSKARQQAAGTTTLP